ncbi:MAG: hypothetical protein JWP91_1671 [Fibrobacteres bacterium]|nr:hypothetical protein [Fibrobacterota bacterium]
MSWTAWSRPIVAFPPDNPSAMLLKRFSLYLLPSLLQAALSFGLLPFTTRILDPEDFGTFAILVSLTGLGTSAASLGSSFLLYSHYPALSTEDRKSFLSSLFWSAVAVSLVFAVGFLLSWPILTAHYQSLTSIPQGAAVLSLGAMFASLPWLLAMDITVIEGRPGIYASVAVASALVSSSCNLIGLYVLHLGLLSLFASALAGSLVNGIGGLIVLKPYLRISISRRWMKEIFRVGPVSSAGNFAETMQIAAERSLLSVHVGLGVLGLYNFSQQFRQMVFIGVKAVTRSIWPVTLAEGKDPESGFQRTANVWSLVHVGIAMAGVLFALLGEEITTYLTHGKFTAAYPYISLWMIYLLVKHTGRAELGFLTVTKQSGFLATLMFGAVGVSVLLLFLLIPRFGMVGAFSALFAQDLFYRIGVRVRAHQTRPVPFQDYWAVIGCIGVSSILAFVHFGHPGLPQRAVLFFVTEAMLVFALFKNAINGGHVPFLRRTGAT